MRTNAEIRLTAGLYAAEPGIATVSLMVMPVMIIALIPGLDLGEDQVGLVATFELGTLALTSFALAPFMSHLSNRYIAIAGAGIVVMGFLCASFVHDLQMLIACRTLGGLGAGLALAAAKSALSTARTPQRTAAYVLIGANIQSMTFVALLPQITTRWSYSGAYLFLAIWVVLIAPLSLLLPGKERAQQHAASETSTNINDDQAFPVLYGGAAILSIFFVGLADGSIWGFTGRIAETVGFSQEAIGMVLGVTVLSGLTGSIAALLLGTRSGLLPPLVIALVIAGGAAFMVCVASLKTTYAAAQIFYNLAAIFCLSYLWGICALLDRSGRVTVAAGGSFLLGISLGPLMAGTLIVDLGFAAVGYTAMSLLFAAIIGMIIAAKGIRRQEQTAHITH